MVTFGTTTFFHIRTENMYLCAVSKQNVNTALVRAAAGASRCGGSPRRLNRPLACAGPRGVLPPHAQVFEFLYKFVDIGKSYFNKFDENVIKDNYVLVYELLDGAPLTSWGRGWHATRP